MPATRELGEKMKTYLTATDALIDYLHWLKERGEFNSVELHEKLKKAEVPADLLISQSLFRMLLLGNTQRLTDHRATAACRVFGIQVAVINPIIPDGWKAKEKPKKK